MMAQIVISGTRLAEPRPVRAFHAGPSAALIPIRMIAAVAKLRHPHASAARHRRSPSRTWRRSESRRRSIVKAHARLPTKGGDDRVSIGTGYGNGKARLHNLSARGRPSAFSPRNRRRVAAKKKLLKRFSMRRSRFTRQLVLAYSSARPQILSAAFIRERRLVRGGLVLLAARRS